MEKDISGDTSGYLKKILIGLLQGQRPTTNEVDLDEAENDAKTLYEAGEKKWGTDESKFVDILLSRRFDFIFEFNLLISTLDWISDAHLKAVCDAYGQFSKKDIEDAIKSETSGNLCRGLLAIGKSHRIYWIIEF